MSTETKKTDAGHADQQKSPAVIVFATVADTTWRLFVPIVIGCVGGVIADRNFGTKPWLTITFIVLGVVIAGLLIKQQLSSGMKK